MLLAPNDTILKQFKHNITKYNNYNGDSLSVRELKEYESADNTSLLEETIVFIARSDLLDCKENVGKDKNAKRLDYKNYCNDCGWYILLDEAHKGDSKEVGFTLNGDLEVKNIFNGNKIFENPKPIGLLKRICEISTKSDDIILDFFAGSGTTAQAVMELNAEDKGNRKFILVQIDEEIIESKSKTAYDFCKNELGSKKPVISDITIERVKRAGEKIANANPDFTICFSVLSLSDKRELITDKQGTLGLLSNAELSPFDKALNLSLQSGKTLDKPLKPIFENKLYQCEDCLYLVACDKEVLEFLRKTQNEYIFIDGFEDLSLEYFLNLDSSLSDRLRIVY